MAMAPFQVVLVVLVILGWLVGWLVSWLVERLTAVSVVHRHNLHSRGILVMRS